MARRRPRAALRIEYKPLDSLAPYERNPRRHPERQLEMLRASLLRFGWTNPILVADGRMIAGHGRREAALAIRDAGETIPNHPDATQAPTIDLSHLSADERRAYVIVDNRAAEMAVWDVEILGEEIGDLSLNGFDPGLIGFSADDLAALPGVGAEGAQDAAEDSEPAAANAYKEQYGVIVICKDEQAQRVVYERLRDEGLIVRVVAT